VNWFLLTKELIDVLIKIYAGFLFIIREETKTKSMVDLWILVDKERFDQTKKTAFDEIIPSIIKKLCF